jgi:quinolinate synthase
MKLMTLEKIIDVLENGTNEVNVTEELRREAMKPLERMLELSR